MFTHTYRSSAWAPSAHVFGGVDVKAWRRVYFSGEARYLWSHADLGQTQQTLVFLELTQFVNRG